MNKVIYRPDIDGLRAIAIFSVIIYHAKIYIADNIILPGGFLGVDIFFVISGYLITSIILKEIKDTGTIKLLNFFENRSRRLLPILFISTIFFIPFGYFFLMPSNLIEFAYSQIFSTFFTSNIYFFFTDQQYGALEAIYKPFLHTWSLGVEIQYYILFPLIILIYFRIFKSLNPLFLLIIILLSLSLANYLSDGNLKSQTLNFYGLLTRIWEIFIGALAAIHKKKISENNKLIISIFSLILIALSFFYFNDSTKHPSYISLIPVIATYFLIICNSKKNFVYKLLSNKIIVFFGLISYSLYIWHYPIFSFFRISGFLSGLYLKQIYIALIVIFISIISYKFLEKPFRNKKKIKLKKLLFFYLSSIFIISMLNFNTINNDGYKNRLPEIFVKRSNIKPWLKTKQDGKICIGRKTNICIFGKENNKKNIYLIGSSRIASIQEEFIKKFSKSDFNIVSFAGYNNCNPNKIFKKESIIICEIQEEETDQSLQEKKKIINRYLDSGHTLVLIFPIPSPLSNVPMKLFSILPKNKKEADIFLKKNEYIVTTKFENYLNKNNDIISFFEDEYHENLSFVYPANAFCNTVIKGRCLTHDGKNFYYYDSGHLDTKGSEILTNLIFKKITSLKNY